jgi:predicted nucleic acid-binding protein
MAMTETGYLFDTGIWVEVERGRLAAADVQAITGDAPVYLSPVTVAELAYGAENAADESLRQRRRAALRRLKRKPLLRIDADTGEVFGSVAAALHRSGRGTASHRTQDVWLAAQAIQYGLCLLTFNRKDFEDIPGLTIRVLSH